MKGNFLNTHDRRLHWSHQIQGSGPVLSVEAQACGTAFLIDFRSVEPVLSQQKREDPCITREHLAVRLNYWLLDISVSP